MDSTLITILTGSGVCGAFCLLFIFGIVFPRGVVDDLREENKELKAAVASERDRANAAVTAATATRDILAAIQYGRDLTSGHGGSP